MLMLLFNDDKNDEVVDGNIDESHASVRVYGSAQPTYYSALLILTLFGWLDIEIQLLTPSILWQDNFFYKT